MAFDHSLVTTALEVPNYKVAKNFGIVRGIVVRSRSIFGSMGASLKKLVGGNITFYTELWEKVRMESYELMIRHADQIGANGIISMRYDATEISDGVTEVLCYGTAVTLTPA